MPDVQHKRGTRSALDTLAGTNGLLPGQVYLITDEDRLAVALSASAYETFAKVSEVPMRVAPYVAQVYNSDTATDINTAGWTDIPINGTTHILDGSHFAISGAGLQCLVAGRVKATANVHYGSSVARAAVALRFAIDGTPDGPQSDTGYIRATDGHNNASLQLTAYFDVAANTVITVRGIRTAAAGVVTLQNEAKSNFILEQWP